MTDTEVHFNPFEPGFTEDPYPHWRALREHDPVHETPLGIWLLLRHADVLAFVRNPTTSVDDSKGTPGLREALFEEVLGDVPDNGSRSMLNVDAPDHTRLRRLVSKAFTPRAISQLQPRVQQLVDEALDRAAAAGGMELVGDLAFPLPFAVITELLGMPATDTDQLRSWTGTIVRSLEPVVDPQLVREIYDASVNLRALIDEAIAWKRRNLGDDMLSALIAAEDAGDVLSDDELAEQVALLYIAGHETTVNLIGNGTLALLRNRAQLERLRDDPSLDANAVEELLRFDPPVQMTRRITLDDIAVGGKVIPQGTFVACVIASANRDPARFGPDADSLDVTRADAHDHVAFGGGIHYCLGAALARLEGQAAIGRLVRRFPSLELAAEPEYNGRINLRGPARLPLSIA
jgi:cytochrome P450